MNDNEYKTCPDCCYDILDDEGDVMDHECISDNEMIAEFMGYEVKYDKCYSPKYNDGTIAPMQFDSSWDWLMPVVLKCFDTQQPEEGQHYFINESLLTMKIEVVYDRVVEFIKTYNDEKNWRFN